MTRLLPMNPSIPTRLLVSLPASATATTASAAPAAVTKACRKIRFYPEAEARYVDALFLYRRAYNLAAERYIKGDHVDSDGKAINLRPQIKAICKAEQEATGRAYNSLICDNAVREARTSFVAVASRNKGKKAEDGLSRLHFKSRKGEVHSFRMCRMPAGLSPAVKVLGKITLTEPVPAEAIDQAITVTRDKGRWFLNVQMHVSPAAEKQGQVKCISIDPGVRTFATCYSEGEAVIAGEHIARDRLAPLMKQVDQHLSRRQRLLNQFNGVRFLDMPQWVRDRLTHIDKAVRRLKCRKEDLVRDLHLRLAHYLTETYDVIFLPHFRTRGMVRRTKGRVLRRNTCRQMLDLGHYRFKLLLKWLAKKKGKRVLDVNESYTSKTLSHTGRVIENLGGRKLIRDGNAIVDRDINAARGIFIKTLSRAT